MARLRLNGNAVLTLLLLACCNLVSAGQKPVDTMTGVMNERIRSLQVQLDGDRLAPAVIVMNTTDRIRVSFDHLSEDREYFRYRLVHCNSRWQPSGLVDSEFLDGFNEGVIEDYDFSRATLVHYTHYTLTIPNADVTPKLSGNYLLQIYQEDDPDEVWLQCRFMVSEQSAGISAQVSSRTDVDFNEEHQQLEIAVNTERAQVEDPFNDLFVVISQNGRLDNEVAVRQPLRLSGKTAIYEHQQPLIFEAGNEYRRMEVSSTTFPGMHVAAVEYLQPYYHFTLMEDEIRADQPYLYDQTQHGRYFIREYNSSESDVEADYVVVHFSLDAPEDPSQMIFLDGDFVHRRFDPESLMTYNRATGRYERAMLLKQGAYNYQYLTLPQGKSRGYTSVIEGDKYETVNEYLIKVYHRRRGERYDRLIGVSRIMSGK